jgi:hypothetical protein
MVDMKLGDVRLKNWDVRWNDGKIEEVELRLS